MIIFQLFYQTDPNSHMKEVMVEVMHVFNMILNYLCTLSSFVLKITDSFSKWIQQRGKTEEALQLAQLSAEKPHFSHCLEWLLFTVFDAEISR